MISFRQYIGEADEPKEVKQVFSVGMASIIQQLDAKAHEVADGVDSSVEITNSAIDEAGKFTRAGEHVVTVQVRDKESGGLELKTALAVLQAYIGRFLGPDEAKKIKEDKLNPILAAPEGSEGDGAAEGQADAGGSGGGDDEEDELDESRALREADEDDDSDDASSADDEDDGDEGDEDDDSDDADEDDDGDEGDDEDDSGDEGDEEEGKDLPLGYYVGY